MKTTINGIKIELTDLTFANLIDIDLMNCKFLGKGGNIKLNKKQTPYYEKHKE